MNRGFRFIAAVGAVRGVVNGSSKLLILYPNLPMRSAPKTFLP